MLGGEGAGSAGLRQRGGSGQRTWFSAKDLKIVVEVDALPMHRRNPRVAGDLSAPIEHDQLRYQQRHPHRSTDHACGDGVLRHSNGDQTRPVNPRAQLQAQIETLERQRRKMFPLDTEVLTYCADPVGDPSALVGFIPNSDAIVQLRQRRHHRHRRQTVAAEPSNLALDPTLLMRALDSRLAIERVEPVVRVEQHPAFILGPPPAPAIDHRRHRGRQVVVFDVLGRDSADRLERVDVSLEERLLTLRRVDPVNRFPRVGKPEREHVALRLHAGEHHPNLPEIDLRFGARRMLLRDENLQISPDLRVNLGASAPDIIADSRVRQLDCTMLLSKPSQDAPGRVTLLSRRRRVLD